jgi:uncharacterized protein (TIGR00369 family)
MEKARISVAEFAELVRAGLPFAEVYGTEMLEIGYGTARSRIPFRESFIRPGGTLNGPLLMALADLTTYAAILGAIGNQPLAVTRDLSIQFLRRPPPVAILAEAKLIRLGKRSAVVRVEEYSEGGSEMVAHAVVSYALPPT